MALTEEGLISVPGIASRWVRLASGARAHYMTAGDTGPAVILLHGGLPGSSGIAGWRFMMPYLAEQGFRVFAPDRPGFGLADAREEYWPHYGMFSWSDFVHDFATAIGLDRFHLSGNSQGAGVTAQYLVEHPERVISYILIASFSIHAPLGLDKDGKARERHPGLAIPAWDGKKETMRNMMESIIYRKAAISDDLITMRTNMAITHDGGFKAAVAFTNKVFSNPSYAQRANLVGKLDKIDIPGIYLFGADDVLIPPSAAYEQEKVLTNIQFYYPTETGHQGQTDRPELFNKVYAEFFKTGKLSPELEKDASVSSQKAVPATW